MKWSYAIADSLFVIVTEWTHVPFSGGLSLVALISRGGGSAL